MRLGNKLTIDSDAEENGIWVDLPEDWWWSPEHPAAVCVRGMQSKRCQAAVRAYAKDAEDEKLSVEEHDERTARLLADDVLVNWRGIFDEDGNELGFTPQLALGVLTNRDNRQFADFIATKSADLDTFNRTS